MSAYYNEHDPFAAAWLRELIKAGQIAPGEVDERSIEDILPSDLRGFAQCHFFAGIGVWSYALRQAGWPDDRQVWTGSCPCQPFSAAGKRTGVTDERHLWPAFYHLIRECQPGAVFGEQVSSKDGLAWFDAVHADLEEANYSVGAFDLCSAGFGAPHIRQRLYFVGTKGMAHAEHPKRRAKRAVYREAYGRDGFGGGGFIDRRMANPDGLGSSEKWQQRSRELLQSCQDEGASEPVEHSTGEQVGLSGQSRVGRNTSSRMANNNNKGLEGRERVSECSPELATGPCGLVNGFWRDADWVFCRDQKFRPIEPGSSPLATGIINRVGKLRGYGNALTAEVAKGFIESYLEVEREAE